MLSEADILWAKLKGTALNELEADLEKEIGEIYDVMYREYNEVLLRILKYYHRYYSTTELRICYFQVAKKHNNLQHFANVEEIKAFDQYLDLSYPPLDKYFQYQTWLSKKNNVVHRQHSKVNGAPLKNLLKRLKLETDPRKMRRLKRKEKKRLKKGVRLFNSNECL